MKTTEAYSIEGSEDHWTVDCPHCNYGVEMYGYFDSSEIIECHKCYGRYKIDKLHINNNRYIK